MTKVAIYILAFYGIYILFLSRDTLYSRNRTFILTSVLISFVLPFLRFGVNDPLNINVFGKVMSDVLVTASKSGKVNRSGEVTNVFSLINNIYIAGILIFGLKFLVDFLELVFLILKNKNASHVVRFSGFRTAGFSACGRIFINTRLNEEESQAIMIHEQKHLDQKHFTDILFMEAVMVMQWFNPFIHLMNRSLRAVHEFQADESCLKNGIPVSYYQRLLLNQVFRTNIFGLTNSFSNPTLIRKRMLMMTRERSGNIANLKVLLILPVILILLSAFSYEMGSFASIPPPPPPPPSPAAEKIEEKPFAVAEIMPEFPGGDNALLKYISENTQYPETAKRKFITGKVIVRFVVSKDGTVSAAEILKGVDPVLDNEALRVVNTLPSFKPAMNNGKPVPVYYMVPITFMLR